MTSSQVEADATVRAAEWYARLHVEDPTADDRLAFARWEAASPHNARAWKAVVRASSALDREAADRDDPVSRALHMAVRRRMSTHYPQMGVVAAAIGVIVVAALGTTAVRFVRDGAGISATPHRQVTGPDGLRGVHLADGTVMTLDARSTVLTSTSGSARSVTLEQGRAFFAVAGSINRPFVVTADGNRITSLGTRFAIRVVPRHFTVDLIEGSLRVEMPAIRRTTVLAAGNHLTVVDGVLRIDATGAFKAAGWRDGPLKGE